MFGDCEAGGALEWRMTVSLRDESSPEDADGSLELPGVWLVPEEEDGSGLLASTAFCGVLPVVVLERWATPATGVWLAPNAAG